jgi:hypothetical protein
MLVAGEKTAARIAARNYQGFLRRVSRGLQKPRIAADCLRWETIGKTQARALANRRLQPLGHVSVVANQAFQVEHSKHKSGIAADGEITTSGLASPFGRDDEDNR